jgi:predicted secreted protein
MALTTAIAIYFLIWWLTLFIVLPWGVTSQYEEGAPGTDPGAPRVPHVGAKLIWTTVVATAIFAVLAVVYRMGWITLDDLAVLVGFPG